MTEIKLKHSGQVSHGDFYFSIWFHFSNCNMLRVHALLIVQPTLKNSGSTLDLLMTAHLQI